MLKNLLKSNFRVFIVKVAILVALIFLVRVAFQFPVEYFKLALFKQTDVNRLFSKIDALQVLALVSVFFGFYFRERIAKLAHPRLSLKKSVLFTILGIIIVALYYLIRASTNYFGITGGLPLYVVWLGIILSLGAAAISFAVAVFDFKYLKIFINEFMKELIFTAVISVILYNLLMLFQQQWLFFSGGVSTILYKLLSLSFNVIYNVGEAAPILRIGTFGVSIGPPCSGIDSMFLFTAFFAGLFALDHKRMNKLWYALLFVIGFIGVYFINVLRLYLLMLAGIYISPNFAVGMFHTNAGWVLFILYFLGYYMLIRKFIYIKTLPGNDKQPIKKGNRK